MLQSAQGSEIKKWLTTTSQVLHERPERLQKLVLHISRKNPDIGFYASNLASLRMAGGELDHLLAKIWNADSVNHVDEIIGRQLASAQPSCQAITFLASLIKTDLIRGYRLHRTLQQ